MTGKTATTTVNNNEENSRKIRLRAHLAHRKKIMFNRICHQVRKASRGLNLLLILALLTSSSEALAFFDDFISFLKGASTEKPAKTETDNALKICAEPQLYLALTNLQEQQPAALGTPFALYFNTATDLYAQLANNQLKCDVLLSSSERLPILLIRSGKAMPGSMSSFARVPLVLYSADPQLFKDGRTDAISGRKLKSLALPNASLTPAGFAAAEIAARPDFPTNYIKQHIYRAEQEYQVYAMVSGGNVQAGFLTLPLITAKDGSTQGSHWLVPQDLYPPLYYYALSLKGGRQDESSALINKLTFGKEAQPFLRQAGFTPLTAELE